MHTVVKVEKVREDEQGTQLYISIPGKYIKEMVLDKHIRQAEMRFDDGRHISIEQGKKLMQLLQILLPGAGMCRNI